MSNRFFTPEDSVFVGRVHRDASREDFERVVRKWGDVVHCIFGGPGRGFGCVKFGSKKARDAFLAKDEGREIMGVRLDVKVYGMNRRPELVSPAPTAAPLVAPTPTIDPILTDSIAQTAVVTQYVGDEYGVLKTTDGVSGFFHVNAAYVCTAHGHACRQATCPFYRQFTRNGDDRLQQFLPLNSTVNFHYRNIPSFEKSGAKFEIQVTLLWCLVKPKAYKLFPDSLLSQQKTDFYSLYSTISSNSSFNSSSNSSFITFPATSSFFSTTTTPTNTVAALDNKKISPQLATFWNCKSKDEAVINTKAYGSFVITWKHLQHYNKYIDTSVPISTYINENKILTVQLKYSEDGTIQPLGLTFTAKYTQPFDLGQAAHQPDNNQPLNNIAPIRPLDPAMDSVQDEKSEDTIDDEFDKLTEILTFVTEELTFLNKPKLHYFDLAMKLLPLRTKEYLTESDVARIIDRFEMSEQIFIGITHKRHVIKRTYDMLLQQTKDQEGSDEDSDAMSLATTATKSQDSVDNVSESPFELPTSSRQASATSSATSSQSDIKQDELESLQECLLAAILNGESDDKEEKGDEEKETIIEEKPEEPVGKVDGQKEEEAANDEERMETPVEAATEAAEKVIKGRQMVKIKREDSHEICEFSTNLTGDLPVDSVLAVFESTSALKYPEGGVNKICSKEEGVFKAPGDGWKNRVYIAIQPTARAPLAPPPPLGQPLAPPTSGTASLLGFPPFPPPYGYPTYSPYNPYNYLYYPGAATAASLQK